MIFKTVPVLALVVGAIALTPVSSEASTERYCGKVGDPSPHKIYASGASCEAAKSIVRKGLSKLQSGARRANVSYAGKTWRCSTRPAMLLTCKRGSSTVYAVDLSQ